MARVMNLKIESQRCDSQIPSRVRVIAINFESSQYLLLLHACGNLKRTLHRV